MIERPLNKRALSVTGPLVRAATITPNDTADLAFETRALLIGRGGDVTLTTAHGDTVILKNRIAGVMYPIAAQRVHQTDTSAAEIVGLA